LVRIPVSTKLSLSPEEGNSPSSAFGVENLDPNDEKPNAFHVASVESSQSEVSYTYERLSALPTSIIELGLITTQTRKPLMERKFSA